MNRVFCFNLYKLLPSLQEQWSSIFIYDLQLLEGLKLNKKENVDDFFDREIHHRYFELKAKINAHLKSYKNSKIEVSNYSLEKLIPENLYENFLQEKMNCLKTYISNIDMDVESFYSNNYANIFSVLKLSNRRLMVNGKKEQIRFSIFGSKNSRFIISKNCVNVYGLPKEKRTNIVAPDNFIFAQLDYKGFQPRIALALFGDETIKKQLKETEDIYSLFEGSREDNKLELISWLFSNRTNKKFDDSLDCIKNARKNLFEKSKSGRLLNIFKRPIFFNGEEENVVLQNYIVSIEADCILGLIKDFEKYLSNMKSYLILPFYDCLIFCISDEEIGEINHLKDHMEIYLYEHLDTKFSVEIKIGKDLFNLKKYA